MSIVNNADVTAIGRLTSFSTLTLAAATEKIIIGDEK